MMTLLSAQWQPKGLTVSACLTLILDYVLFYCLSKHWSHFVAQADFELSVIFLYLALLELQRVPPPLDLELNHVARNLSLLTLISS